MAERAFMAPFTAFTAFFAFAGFFAWRAFVARFFKAAIQQQRGDIVRTTMR
jgi:hypothetical protein